MEDECIVCHEPLKKHATVFAGLGHLFCSRQCAVKYLAGNVDPEILANYAIDGCIEEVQAEDIGIS